jgi:hypothetical protein
MKLREGILRAAAWFRSEIGSLKVLAGIGTSWGIGVSSAQRRGQGANEKQTEAAQKRRGVAHL